MSWASASLCSMLRLKKRRKKERKKEAPRYHKPQREEETSLRVSKALLDRHVGPSKMVSAVQDRDTQQVAVGCTQGPGEGRFWAPVTPQAAAVAVRCGAGKRTGDRRWVVG